MPDREAGSRSSPRRTPLATHRAANPCAVPKSASCLQIGDFSGCAPNLDTPQPPVIVRFCTELREREFEPLVVRELELTAFPKRRFATLDGGPIGPLRNRSAFVRLRLGRAAAEILAAQ